MTSRREDVLARWVVGGAFAWFAARLVYLAVAVDPSVPPDETTHVGRVLAFAATWGIPEPGPDNHALGLLGDRPFLYNWLLGRVASLASFALDETSRLVALRLVNAALALATAAYGVLAIRIVTTERLAHAVFAVLVTNTLMLTGIGASVSYDNGANLLGAVSFYYLARLFRDARPRDLASLAIVLGLGCLTKRSFLPVAALFVLAVLLHERRRAGELVASIARMGRLRTAVAMGVALATLWLYGGNWLEYGRLVPEFDQVVGLEAARQNRIFARDTILDDYREGVIDLPEAMRRTSWIDHAGDRAAARRQLAGLHRRGDERIGPVDYTALWVRIMIDRAFGYFGHQVVFVPPWQRYAHGGVLLLGVVLHVATWRRRPDPIARWGGGLAIAYAAVLLWIVNYPNYLSRGIVDAGVQGRYLFPVWTPLMVWLACALGSWSPARLRWPLAGLVCGLFLYGDLPAFLQRAAPTWFTGTP